MNPNASPDEVQALLDRLEQRLRGANHGDAIDATLVAPRRTTQAVSLRDHPAVERFRRELSDGLIRADTAHRFLSLIRILLESASP